MSIVRDRPGAMAAISAAREGMHVALLEPGTHVGGMLTGGLSATDVGNPNVIGGDALEFFERVGRYYDMSQYDQKVSWRFEPHVGEEILRSMLKESGVDLRFHERLREKNGVAKDGNRLVSITTEDGAVWQGRVFADRRGLAGHDDHRHFGLQRTMHAHAALQ